MNKLIFFIFGIFLVYFSNYIYFWSHRLRTTERTLNCSTYSTHKNIIDKRIKTT